MASTVSLADLGQRLALSAAELNFMRSTGVRTADGAHNLLTASLTGSDARFPVMDVGRRRTVAEALTPLLSHAYNRALVQGVECPRGAAAPSAKALSSALNLQTSTQAQAKLQGLPAIDLVGDRYVNWQIQDQGDRQACVAFAVASCLELLRATQGTTFVPLSPQFLYWHIRTTAWPPPPPPGWDEGATKLGYAQQILATKGICRWDTCPYDTNLHLGEGIEGPKPSDTASAEGAANLVITADYQAQQKPGTAKRVYDHLRRSRPVAIAVPVYAQSNESSVTNWSSGITSGEVLDPYRDGIFVGGHAVCVVAFQPDPSGGWFIFRNSVGGNWASGFQPDGDPPRVPAPGYGAISAAYVEGYCWEYLSLILP